MCAKDEEIKELRARVDHEVTVGKLVAERELMFWQGKAAKWRFMFLIPALVGAGVVSVLELALKYAEVIFK